MPKPIVILAFSNSSGTLPHLEEESTRLRRMFMPLRHRNLIELWDRENLTLPGLEGMLHRTARPVSIFHYGGHATPEGIQVGNGAIKLGKLARQMIRYWKPQLIFLNGCETAPIAEELLCAGAKCVIATTRPIEDEAAAEFADRFYQRVLRGDPIREAYDSAAELYLADERRSGALRSSNEAERHFSEENVSETREVPWVLLPEHPTSSAGKRLLRDAGINLIFMAKLVSVTLALLFGMIMSGRLGTLVKQLKAQSGITMTVDILDQFERQVTLTDPSPFELRIEDQVFPLIRGRVVHIPAELTLNRDSVRLALVSGKATYSDPSARYAVAHLSVVQIRTSRMCLKVNPNPAAPSARLPAFINVRSGSDCQHRVMVQNGYADGLLPFSCFDPHNGILFLSVDPPHKIEGTGTHLEYPLFNRQVDRVQLRPPNS